MRQDLDRLMKEQGLAGLVVFAYDRYSPAMYYATGQKLHFGVYFRTADGGAHLIHDPMERDQAAQVGCDPTAVQLLRHRGRRAGATEAVKHKTALGRYRLDNAL